MSEENGTGTPPEGEGKGAETPTLDQLLEDWDKRTAEPENEDGKVAVDKSVLESLLANQADINYKLERPEIIKMVKGDLDIDDEIVENFVNGQASRDKRLMELWEKRDENRDEFNQAMQALNATLAKGLKLESKANESEPDNELAAALRASRDGQGAGTALDNTDVSSLATHEFEMYKQKVFAAAKAGQLK